MTTTAARPETRFCSVCARQAGLDPVGHAHAYAQVLAVEIPLPWPESMYETPGILPQELVDFRKLLIEAYQRGEPLHRSAFAIAPDAAYSRPGYRRVISYRHPDGPFAAFEQQEYLVPEADCGPLCWALLVEPSALPRFAPDRQPPSGVRDLLVCTHGAVDAACAKFGFLTYRQLRRLADQSQGRLRAWRVSHFGGHVFAPTLLDMPEFRSWAYIEREQAELLADHHGDVASLRDHYRGWAGLESPLLQVAERELFVRYGWPWTTYLKQGQVLAQDAAAPNDHDAAPTWAEVQIDYATPDGAEHGIYVARVELASHVESIYSSSQIATHAYPQYVVTRLERVVSPSLNEFDA
jgi:hypothetical protein